jgi:tetratricopeptide (TPR) repeat protein
MAQSLGLRYAKQEEISGEEQRYLHELARQEDMRGPERGRTLELVYNLGRFYAGQGRVTEAEQTYQRALSGYGKILGQEDPKTLKAIHSLGDLYVAQGKLADAEKMFQQELAVKQLQSGGPDTLALGYSICSSRYL